MNWMRRTEQSIDRASALASLVLPTPGTSSMSRWPSASSTARASRTVAVLPSMTCSMLATMALALRANSSAPIGCAPSSSQVRCGVVTGSSSFSSVMPGAGTWTRKLGSPALLRTADASCPAVDRYAASESDAACRARVVRAQPINS